MILNGVIFALRQYFIALHSFVCLWGALFTISLVFIVCFSAPMFVCPCAVAFCLSFRLFAFCFCLLHCVACFACLPIIGKEARKQIYKQEEVNKNGINQGSKEGTSKPDLLLDQE